MNPPDFFIVGAPKCGTTALQAYLVQHPQVYMPELKESHHFATDLILEDDHYRSLEHYLDLFLNARRGQRVGEASVFYLYSNAAARNIHEFSPKAKIIAMFRNPTEMIQSYHSQLVFNGDENILDLAQALSAEVGRKQGRLIPGNLRFVQRLFYSEIICFAEQLERYFSYFGHEQVHVIIYDDFKSDTAKVYQGVLEFLNVNADFTVDFRPININKRVRSQAINRFVSHQATWVRVVKQLLPSSLTKRIGKILRMANTKYEPRVPLPPELKTHLQAQYASEVARLSELLGRDLSHWNCA